ncbi:unnamed protein product [Lactuca saligna]|uniref:Uncharacterized protein n=1 Tax=Lactuca saligna TaxID=75948 RepID=A0AA35YEC0_LACSI|nr:unnamed protein product [Lactuca saligna]
MLFCLSLGPFPPQPDYFEDVISIGSFHDFEKGIVVCTSAGNSFLPSTATNVAPWILTVSASTIDREFPSYVLLGNDLGDEFEKYFQAYYDQTEVGDHFNLFDFTFSKSSNPVHGLGICSRWELAIAPGVSPFPRYQYATGCSYQILVYDDAWLRYGYPAVNASYYDLTFHPNSSNKDYILYKNRQHIKCYNCDSRKHNLCRLYFGEHNIEGVLKTYHHELLEAYECCMEYKRTGKDAELTEDFRVVIYQELGLILKLRDMMICWIYEGF